MSSEVFDKDITRFLRERLNSDIAAKIVWIAGEIDKQIHFEWVLRGWSVYLIGNSQGICFIIGEIRLEEEGVSLRWKHGGRTIILDNVSADLDNLFAGDNAPACTNTPDYYLSVMGDLIMSEENTEKAKNEFMYGCMLIDLINIRELTLETLAAAVGARDSPRIVSVGCVKLQWREIVDNGELSFLLEISTPAISIMFIKVEHAGLPGYCGSYGKIVSPSLPEKVCRLTSKLVSGAIGEHHPVVFPAEIAEKIVADVFGAVAAWESRVTLVDF